MTILALPPDLLDTTLPPPEVLEQEIPLTPAHANFIEKSRQTIEQILEGKDPRKLLIVGPCSIHDLDATREYADYLHELAKEVSDRFYLVMRTYFEKSRTSLGWKGFLYDPDRDSSFDLAKGIRQTRELLADLTSKGVPVGGELLEMTTAPYYSDFYSWGCIGARTSSSPPHRQLASSLPMPIGFKNTIDGNLNHPIHGILVANSPQVCLNISSSGQLQKTLSEGNPYAHLVLRGSEKGPNYSPEEVEQAARTCMQAGLPPRFLVDCSHDNCRKDHALQIPAFESIMRQIERGSPNIAGLMLESHLLPGSQPLSDSLRYGVSITDPCLGWEMTSQLIRSGYQALS
ncbi:MAG: Phospho-2-dehydro-3-deoxyheptonate aldolase, Tyr-sensitive [Chlamydiae bacterium]|nr:Phospho-2-dehydro-3-deoxyheptonate aldolase, Tyr-sensitive [Chlamydiota bacterium]